MMSKSNISPKSPQIELSIDMFAKRKCCEVFAYKVETFHRRRFNGMSHCDNGKQKRPETSLPLARGGPHLIQQCLGPPHTPPQTAASMVKALSHTDAVKSPLVTMARPKIAPKSTPSRGPIPKPHYLSHPWTRPTYDAKTASGSDPPFFPNALDSQTDRLSDRQIIHGKV